MGKPSPSTAETYLVKIIRDAVHSTPLEREVDGDAHDERYWRRRNTRRKRGKQLKLHGYDGRWMSQEVRIPMVIGSVGYTNIRHL